LNQDRVRAVSHCATLATERRSFDGVETDIIPLITGSVAEFYIKPMLSCVGDVDVMYHYSDQLAIPAGTHPPTQLPDEFHSRVNVFEIVDSEFPGYVYLVSSYLLTECTDEGKYNAVECDESQRQYLTYKTYDESHGPAIAFDKPPSIPVPLPLGRGSGFSLDIVYCMRCLSWPPQATDWPTRHRKYGWPDSATVDRVVSNGCDVVGVAHRQCRQDEWMGTRQHRLSFSRAEIVLLNSWIPVQQIVYHLLRVFVKTEGLTDSADNSDATTLSNYHIKTLMLWACELKPRWWWIDDLNLVRLSVELLRILSGWLTNARCRHYFIQNCNLFDHRDCSQRLIANRLIPETEASLAQWFTKNYTRKCAQLWSDSVLRLFDDISNNRTELQKAISAVVDWRLNSLWWETFVCFLHTTSMCDYE